MERDEKGRWPPGTSGNPAGKPKGIRTLSSDLYKILGEVAAGDELVAMYDALEIPEGLRGQIDLAENRQEAFARCLVFRMMTGNWSATSEIFGRLDPIPARSEISGPRGAPIQTVGAVLTGPVAPDDAAAVYQALLRGEDPDEQDLPDDLDG